MEANELRDAGKSRQGGAEARKYDADNEPTGYRRAVATGGAFDAATSKRYASVVGASSPSSMCSTTWWRQSLRLPFAPAARSNDAWPWASTWISNDTCST